jgi:hypothetical protein
MESVMDAKTSDFEKKDGIITRTAEERKAAWENLKKLRKRVGEKAKKAGLTEADLKAIRNG